MARDIQVGQHRFRFVYTKNGKGGCYKPILTCHLRGPNGSPAGIGPKGWPRVFRPLFPNYWLHRDRWSSTIVFPLPHITFATGYRLKRVGGLWAYRTVQRWYFKLERKTS